MEDTNIIFFEFLDNATRFHDAVFHFSGLFLCGSKESPVNRCQSKNFASRNVNVSKLSRTLLFYPPSNCFTFGTTSKFCPKGRACPRPFTSWFFNTWSISMKGNVSIFSVCVDIYPSLNSEIILENLTFWASFSRDVGRIFTCLQLLKKKISNGIKPNYSFFWYANPWNNFIIF